MPFCGDSLNESHGHLSIKIDVNSDAPMVYRCLKCNISGLVTDTFLEEIDIFLDEEHKKDLKLFTKKSMKVARLVNLDRESYFVPLSRDTNLTRKKLYYLENRLGISFDCNKAQDYKIVLDFFDFLKANDLLSVDDNHLVGLNYKSICNLNENYIGYLSTNNNSIIFRDITGKQKYRYFKVVINGKNVNPDSFYSIPSKLSLLYTDSIHVHIAEGIFDILSIRESVVKESDHHYYYAICGFGSIGVLKYIIHHGMNTNITLHIYSDNDKTDWNHKKNLSKVDYLLEFIDRIYIHRNKFQNEKDYGVDASKIIDAKKRLK